jgi:hypothetical protein
LIQIANKKGIKKGNETALNINHFCIIKFIYDCLEATPVTGTEKFQTRRLYVQA